MTDPITIKLGGVASGALWVPAADLDRISIKGIPVKDGGPSGLGRVLELGPLHNAFVNQGLQRALDLLFEDTQGALPGISHIGLSADSSAVTASTTSLDPGTAGSSVKTVANVSRTNQTTHGDATWTEADVTWKIYKLGFLYGAGVTNVVNIIGGTGGSNPYNEQLEIDLTNATQFSLRMGIDLTATAS